MKRINLFYWITTGLFSAMMLLSGIFNALATQDSIDFIGGHLGYPTYFILFLGVAKVAGAVALVVPGYHRLKEWAYAGFFFDLIFALVSLAAVGDPPAVYLSVLLFIALLSGSYWLYGKRLQLSPSDA